jgi:hypothetical protein
VYCLKQGAEIGTFTSEGVTFFLERIASRRMFIDARCGDGARREDGVQRDIKAGIMRSSSRVFDPRTWTVLEPGMPLIMSNDAAVATSDLASVLHAA